MSYTKELNIEAGRAICYSGFREGQRPGDVFPSYDEIKEDLLILHNHWRYLRLYDCDKHAETVLEVIDKENLNFKVMLGAYIVAEVNNYGCPWGHGSSSRTANRHSAASHSSRRTEVEDVRLGPRRYQRVCRDSDERRSRLGGPVGAAYVRSACAAG